MRTHIVALQISITWKGTKTTHIFRYCRCAACSRWGRWLSYASIRIRPMQRSLQNGVKPKSLRLEVVSLRLVLRSVSHAVRFNHGKNRHLMHPTNYTPNHQIVFLLRAAHQPGAHRLTRTEKVHKTRAETTFFCWTNASSKMVTTVIIMRWRWDYEDKKTGNKDSSVGKLKR